MSVVRLRPLILLAANVALAALALWPFLPQRAPAEPAPAAASTGDAGQKLASLPPFADFAETSARPLFAPTRRPTPGAAALGIDGRYRLLGLVIAGSARHALVAPVAGGPALELGEGEAIDGWTVTRIERDRVTLASPMGEATLALSGGGAAKR
jgi:hypothetical protein